MLWGMVKAANGGMKGLNRQVEEKCVTVMLKMEAMHYCLGELVMY